MSEMEKTCENCKYEHEDLEGSHCRHCIHNATENFRPKDPVVSEEIRNQILDEFRDKINKEIHMCFSDDLEIQKHINKITEQMKGE